jgi:LCP family protein required for cell wall assembly
MTGRRSVRTAVAVVVGTMLALAAVTLVTHRALIRPAYAGDGVLVVLVIGSDAGPPQRPGDPLRGRADALHLVAVDVAARRATVVDLPRDSMVGGTKVNAHLATGGPEVLVEQIEAFTGLTIDHWALTTFDGFERLTTALGGADVFVDRPMHDEAAGSDFQPGMVHVEGHTALAFSRDRHSLPDGDFGRTRHQGELFLALHRSVVDGDLGAGELVELVTVVGRTTVTDIPRADLLPLASLAVTIEPDAVQQVSLTGRAAMVGAASVVYVEPGDVFSRIADGDIGPSTTPD